MTDQPKEKPGELAAKHEAAAEAVREKMARLKALRLAQEATRPAAPAKTTGARIAGSRIGGKKPAKVVEKAVPLSEWLATQQKEGRRS